MRHHTQPSISFSSFLEAMVRREVGPLSLSSANQDRSQRQTNVEPEVSLKTLELIGVIPG